MPNRTEIAVRQHLAAIQSPLYEVGVFFPATDKTDSKMLLRTWDEATVLKSIPWLRAKNAEGAAIYVRPKDEHQYSLVDDLSAEAVKQMRTEGFTPAVGVETSQANFQAWLSHGEVLDKRTSTAAARSLAARFGGDPGAADWRHFGRLAGFTNRKPRNLGLGGLYPFVRLAEATGVPYPAAEAFVAEVRYKNERKVELPSGRRAKERNDSLSISEFREDPKYGGDGHRIDLAFAVSALAQGASEEFIRDSLLTRDLVKKGSLKRIDDYVARTINKARSALKRADFQSRGR